MENYGEIADDFCQRNGINCQNLEIGLVAVVSERRFIFSRAWAGWKLAKKHVQKKLREENRLSEDDNISVFELLKYRNDKKLLAPDRGMFVDGRLCRIFAVIIGIDDDFENRKKLTDYIRPILDGLLAGHVIRFNKKEDRMIPLPKVFPRK
jgi:hypothetical protein